MSQKALTLNRVIQITDHLDAAGSKPQAKKAPAKHYFVVDAKMYYVASPKLKGLTPMKHKVTAIIDTNLTLKVGKNTYYRILSLKGNGNWDDRVNTSEKLAKYWVLSTDYKVSKEKPKGKYASYISAEGWMKDDGDDNPMDDGVDQSSLDMQSDQYYTQPTPVYQPQQVPQGGISASQNAQTAAPSGGIRASQDSSQAAPAASPSAEPAVNNAGEYFNNSINTQPYRLNRDIQYPVDAADGTRSYVTVPSGSIVWSDAPFSYDAIAPEHKASFPDPNSDSLQGYSWSSFTGATANGGLTPLRRDYMDIVNSTGGTMSAEGGSEGSAFEAKAAASGKKPSCTVCTISRTAVAAAAGLGTWYLLDTKTKMPYWQTLAAAAVVAVGVNFAILKTMEKL